MRTTREAVEALYSVCGNGNPFSGALASAAAFVRFLAFDDNAGLALLREGVRRLLLLIEQHPAEVPPLSVLTKLVGASFLFEPLDWAPTDSIDPGVFELLHPGQWEGRAAVCAAFGDSLYFRTYGARLVQSFAEHTGGDNGLLIGIIAPDGDALALADDLKARYPALALAAVRYGGARLPEYCCSARFLFAETLLELAARPLILTDIDSVFVPGAAIALKMVRAFPLAHICTPEYWPQLTVDASVVGAHPGPAASAFFGGVNAYVRAKLAETGPLWAYDQVALHRAIAALRRAGGEIFNVNTVLPARLHLPGLFKSSHVLPMAEREKLRTNYRMQFTSLGDDLRPRFVVS